MTKYIEQYRCPPSFPWQFANILANNQYLVALLFSNQQLVATANKITTLCKQQLTLYFANKLQVFELPIQFKATEFSNAVHQQLLSIPFGTVVSYQDIATRLGKPNSARAVGRACGSNPLSIIVPCHRVISSQHKLTGYNGGLATKEWLLKHEKSI